MSEKRRVVAFTVPGQGHVNRMLPLVAGLCEQGIPVDFFAHAWARPEIERTGARFIDLYANRPMMTPDSTSTPMALRAVSFAGYWGEDVVREIAPLEPSLILHDTFAVLGRIAAFHLKVPRVNMRAGHNLQPERALAALRAHPGLHISDACQAAVETLRTRHGVADASPFSFCVDDGADLNIYSEPPEFLLPEERAPFEPLEFFGSYWPADHAGPLPPDPFGPGAEDGLKVYAGLGTAVWLECPDLAMMVLEIVADALATYPNARGLITLGGKPVTPADLQRLSRANVRVEPAVDQTAVLRHASAFVCHNGLNSTHEAIIHEVPMLSVPFFGDQPQLAARCQALGLAVPLTPAPGVPPTVAGIHAALDRVQAEGPALRARLAQAHGWENAVMAQRPAVLRRIIDLMG